MVSIHGPLGYEHANHCATPLFGSLEAPVAFGDFCVSRACVCLALCVASGRDLACPRCLERVCELDVAVRPCWLFSRFMAHVHHPCAARLALLCGGSGRARWFRRGGAGCAGAAGAISFEFVLRAPEMDRAAAKTLTHVWAAWVRRCPLGSLAFCSVALAAVGSGLRVSAPGGSSAVGSA